MRYAVPVLLMLGLLALLGYGLTLDPREVPSPLIGKPAPAFDLPQVGAEARYSTENLKGRPVLVNFWASWCAGCQVEHPFLLKLAQDYGVEIVGMDYKDTDADGQAWLKRLGNPYRTLVADAQGTAGLDWGVYGVPETFVLDSSGTIVFKQIGPMTEQAWREHIAPLMAAKTP
ncbi:MAG TPA: DsbE family thiol:disulfide interchange protein [Solimonas sp.]|nr:DsbE family thiol:disulfide interchange protein [Solimonas sp.]